MIRIRGAVVTGLRREEGSTPDGPPWPGAFMGCPPQPVVWQICFGSVSLL